MGHGKIYDPLVERRTWSFVFVAAALGAAVGLVYVLVYDPLCMVRGSWGHAVARKMRYPGGSRVHSPSPYGRAIGIVGGGILGFVADRVTRHR